MHIILVDDDQLTLFIHKKVVEKSFENAKVTCYNKPSKLIEDLQNNNIQMPNLIFSDYNMGALNGVDVLDAVESACMNKDKSFKSDFFLVSSESDLSSIAANLKHEVFNTFISKPLTEEKINLLLDSRIAS